MSKYQAIVLYILQVLSYVIKFSYKSWIHVYLNATVKTLSI